MPNFNRLESELETRLDKWLYFIKHLEDFETIPTIFKDEVFTQAFEKAELAKFGQTELDNYESSLKVFRDNKAVYDYAKQTAYDDGKSDGKLEGKIEVARALKNSGVSIDIIMLSTGMASDEIEKL